MRRFLVPLIAVTLVAVGMGGMAAVALWSDIPSGTQSLRSNRSPGMMDADTDAMFIEQMIPHHEDAIAMADLALTRAEHPEIRELAADIKRSQTAENRQMRRWYREWYGTTVPEWDDSQSSGGRRGMPGGRGPMMRGPMMGGGMTDLDALKNAETFDKEFIEQMVPHHRMAIMMSRMAGRRTDRPEMRRLTDSIIETQSDEIRQMRAWYETWYGDR